MDLKLVSDQLGHSSIVLTADTYVSVCGGGDGPAGTRGRAAITRFEACDAEEAQPARSIQARQAPASRSPTAPADRPVHTGEDCGPVQDRLSGDGEGGDRLRPAFGDNHKGRTFGSAEGMPAGADHAKYRIHRRNSRRRPRGLASVACMGLVRRSHQLPRRRT